MVSLHQGVLGFRGEVYDGVTPIAVVALQTFATGDTLPTSFDFCVLEFGPM